MKITAAKLRKLGACEEDVEKFEETWPKGVRVNKKNCLTAVKLGFDITWAAENLLRRDGTEFYLDTPYGTYDPLDSQFDSALTFWKAVLYQERKIRERKTKIRDEKSEG